MNWKITLTWIKIIACIKTGKVLATFMVPGINWSDVCFVNFSKAVCGENEPIPNRRRAKRI